MSVESDRRRAAIRKFMADNDLKPKPWAKAAKVAPSTLSNFLNKRSESLTQTSLEKLAKAANATVSRIIGETVRSPASMKDLVAIKRLEVRAAMGGGFEIQPEGELEPIYFRRDWIRQVLDENPGQLRAIDLVGDSMLPTIREGDIGLVAVPGGAFESGKIYVLWDGTGIVAKRLEPVISSDHDRQRIRVMSDNAAVHPPYEIDFIENATPIIGRLVWRGGAV